MRRVLKLKDTHKILGVGGQSLLKDVVSFAECFPNKQMTKPMKRMLKKNVSPLDCDQSRAILLNVFNYEKSEVAWRKLYRFAVVYGRTGPRCVSLTLLRRI